MQKKSVLIIVSYASFIIPMMGLSVNVALPSIGRDLNADAILLNWIITAFVMGSAIVVVPIGRIADIYGRKKIFLLGALLCCISCLLIGFINSVLFIIILRTFQGIGVAMILATSVAILTSVFPPAERGQVMGLNVAAVYLGQSIAPSAGGLLTQYFGWRSIFILSIPLCLILVIAIMWKIKTEWKDAQGETFDCKGSILYSLTLICLIYGFSILPSTAGICLLCIGIAGFYLFVKLESNTVHPIININLFRTNSVLTFSSIATLINYMATFGVTFLMSLYLQYIQNLDAKTAGFILLIQPAVQSLLSPLAGKIATRYQSSIIASLGMAITAMGLIILVFTNCNTSLVLIIASLAILGFGYAFFAAPNTTTIMSSVEKEHYGIASATLATMRQVGMVISLAIIAFLFSLIIGKVEITPQYYEAFLRSYKFSLSVFSILCVIGVFISISHLKIFFKIRK